MVGDKGEIRTIVPKLRFVVLDLDDLTTEGEVTDEIRRDYSDLIGKLKAMLFAPNKREERKAVVQMV